VPQLLRGIRQSRWYKKEASPFLEEGDIPADPLGDLSTTQNTLSVYVVNDDSDISRIVTALAAKRQNFSNYDYILFDQSILSQLGIDIEENLGDTPDEEVNRKHCDLVGLSGLRLVELVRLMLVNSDEDDVGRVSKKDIEKWLKEGVTHDHLNLEKIDKELREKLTPRQ
jgi:hypothetical protein